ncbi:sodium-dependent phosphate transporter [Acidisphaera rubrifaciens HS-AP3]|uniref:Sodium-dependent phosphate transporter n=2 Tax=Acidisphaera TaxID=50714 RepID=A0A0D6P5S1_9PROT|nr:sodium-dependent phosphate transporter [Acidisphaera rubrifaciens HS-AP3]
MGEAAMVSPTWTLLDLAGTVALLLWGVHMVQTGIQRAFGPGLRGLLGRALGNRVAAFFSGLGVTAVLQSSTATGLMVAGFAASGLVETVPALAVMLGANVGTTLIVQALSFDVSGVSSVAILVGVILFRRGTLGRTRDIGRFAIGLGLMLLALHQLLDLVTPYEDQPSLRMMLGAIATEPVLDVLVAAGLTWAAHSSVAVVLLVMSLAARGAVPPHAAYALVLGANLGSAINPVLEGAPGDDPALRRVPVGNLINRCIGVFAALLALEWIGPWLVTVEPDAARAVADFHTGFNLLLAAVFLPVLGPYARLLARLLPQRAETDDPYRVRYLDHSALAAPPAALAASAREALRMADVLEAMLAGTAASLAQPDRLRIAETRRMGEGVRRMGGAIRAYLAGIEPDAADEADERRLQQVLAFVGNLEAAADVLRHNVMTPSARRLKQGITLSVATRAEMAEVIRRLTEGLRLAAGILMSQDARLARQMVAEKDAFRALEQDATTDRLAALRGQREDASEGARLDLLREFARVHACLVAAAAYPALEDAGELLPSRLRAES